MSTMWYKIVYSESDNPRTHPQGFTRLSASIVRAKTMPEALDKLRRTCFRRGLVYSYVRCEQHPDCKLTFAGRPCVVVPLDWNYRRGYD